MSCGGLFLAELLQRVKRYREFGVGNILKELNMLTSVVQFETSDDGIEPSTNNYDVSKWSSETQVRGSYLHSLVLNF